MSMSDERETPSGSTRSSMTLAPSDTIFPDQKEAFESDTHLPVSGVEKEQPILSPVPTLPSTGVSVDGPPDGGREAWLVVVGAAAIMFCTFGFSESTPSLSRNN